MSDRADVVPLRRRGAPEFAEPTASFADALHRGRALRLTWTADHRAVQVSIDGGGDGAHDAALVLDAGHVLDLIRALVEGLPQAGAGGARPPAPVLPLHPRPHPSQGST